ncbi:hypothetical protein [Nocardioides sp.]|uniref:hypothetical protein n=1 Tax=Nocardioides sp. TaxID=35761 RepID=UPI003563594D
MTPESWTQLVLALLACGLVASLLGWLPSGRSIWPPVALVLLGVSALVAALPHTLDVGRIDTAIAVSLGGLLAAFGGGPVTTRIFTIIDRGSSDAESITDAGSILRGGAWIGALERLAVFAGLATGFPEGVAVVLALKSVGRFPDLRGDGGSGAATERFIIGTFSSVLWAAACAGVIALTLR